MSEPLHLMRDVLDHELHDADDVSCGMVDDVVFDHQHKTPAAAYLLVGPAAWVGRLPPLFAMLWRKLHPSRPVRVPWSEVEHVGEVIRLRSKASALGLGKADRRAARWVAKLPHA